MERQSPSYELEAEEGHKLPPNHRLLIAVLFRAVRDYVNYKDSKPGTLKYKIGADAAGWIWWNGTEDMTFLKICELLGLNPVKIRKITETLTADELLRMTKKVETAEEDKD